jgi:hypothetical protein
MIKVTFDWSEEKINKVKQLIEEFVYKHEVADGEGVYQCDNPNIDSPRLVTDILETVVTHFEWD